MRDSIRLLSACVALLLLSLVSSACSRARADERRTLKLAEDDPIVQIERSAIPPLSAELRAKGFNECNPHDPLGLGPYAPFGRLPLGRILIPQKGGHTADMGYDVIIHFHGADAVRKLLVQVARGVVLVLVDKGVGGGPYSRALGSTDAFPLLRRSIEGALKRHSGKESAHIRHLAISSWSAGSAAVGKILAQGHTDIDAVVILDGLHGVWKQGAPRGPSPSSVDARAIARYIELAKCARRGERIFVLTHSNVEPYTYPSTAATAQLLLRELGLRPTTLGASGDRFGQLTAVDVGDLHVWGFAGNEEMGHCKQLFLMPRIVNELLETAWDTPAMDRSVPPTPHPDWKHRRRKRK